MNDRKLREYESVVATHSSSGAGVLVTKLLTGSQTKPLKNWTALSVGATATALVLVTVKAVGVGAVLVTAVTPTHEHALE
jgi:hypothetical protein